MASLRIGILQGSTRLRASGAGVSSWVSQHLAPLLSSTQPPETITMHTYPLPLGPHTGELAPAWRQGTPITSDTAPGTPSSKAILDYSYESQRINDWSKWVQQLDALIVVTPSYNGTITGALKDAFDNIYHEFNGLPVAVVSYGVEGGTTSAETLGFVFKVLKSQVVSLGDLAIKIPMEIITSTDRVQGNEKFLEEYEPKLKEALGKLVEAAGQRQKGESQTKA